MFLFQSAFPEPPSLGSSSPPSYPAPSPPDTMQANTISHGTSRDMLLGNTPPHNSPPCFHHEDSDSDSNDTVQTSTTHSSRQQLPPRRVLNPKSNMAPIHERSVPLIALRVSANNSPVPKPPKSPSPRHNLMTSKSTNQGTNRPNTGPSPSTSSSSSSTSPLRPDENGRARSRSRDTEVGVDRGRSRNRFYQRSTRIYGYMSKRCCDHQACLQGSLSVIAILLAVLSGVFSFFVFMQTSSPQPVTDSRPFAHVLIDKETEKRDHVYDLSLSSDNNVHARNRAGVDMSTLSLKIKTRGLYYVYSSVYVQLDQSTCKMSQIQTVNHYVILTGDTSGPRYLLKSSFTCCKTCTNENVNKYVGGTFCLREGDSIHAAINKEGIIKTRETESSYLGLYMVSDGAGCWDFDS